MSDCSKKSTLNKIKKSSIYRASAKFTGDYDEYLSKISNKEAIYLSLIWLRESARDNPLLLICNSDIAYEIINISIPLVRNFFPKF